MSAALISAALSGGVLAAAGRAEFVLGGATVSGTDGRERPLQRGSDLDAGDTVRTSDGRVQIRFSDGAYVSLQPNTEFSIREYRFDGKPDGAERGFFALAKGAMRTVTGLVGRVNRESYRITTPTATVGIRGTGGVIQVLEDGATLIVGTSGIWSLTNAAGSIDVPAGVSALAPATPDAPPQRTSQAPQSGPAPLVAQATFSQGEQRTGTGAPAGVAGTPPLASGAGYAAALAYGLVGDPAQRVALVDVHASVIASFDGSGRLNEATASGSVYKFIGTHAEFGSDGVLAWGRWTGQINAGSAAEGYGPNQGLHYVVGMPTPTLPAMGAATYMLLGATSPTYLDGSTAPGKLTGDLKVDFGLLKVGLNLNVAMPDGRGYAMGGNAQITGSGFSGQTGLTATGSGGACMQGCAASLQGFFAGANAERAGVGYSVTDAFANKAVVGAAAFQRQ